MEPTTEQLEKTWFDIQPPPEGATEPIILLFSKLKENSPFLEENSPNTFSTVFEYTMTALQVKSLIRVLTKMVD